MQVKVHSQLHKHSSRLNSMEPRLLCCHPSAKVVSQGLWEGLPSDFSKYSVYVLQKSSFRIALNKRPNLLFTH